MEKTLEMRFCQSVMLAMQCVLWIVSGKFSFVPKGTVPSGVSPWNARWKGAGIPTWCNFVFFSKVEATSIRKTKLDEWAYRKEREVRFFYGDAVVAIVTLVGEDDATSGWTGWAVSKIRYTLYAGDRQNETGYATGQWVELELELRAGGAFGYTKLPLSIGDQS